LEKLLFITFWPFISLAHIVTCAWFWYDESQTHAPLQYRFYKLILMATIKLLPLTRHKDKYLNSWQHTWIKQEVHGFCNITGSPYAALHIAQPSSADPVPVPSLNKEGGRQ